MLAPPDAIAWALQRWTRNRRAWLDGAGTWPLVRGLEPPTGVGIRAELVSVTRWTAAWASVLAPEGVRIVRETSQMRGIGAQTLPVRLEFDTPRAVSEFVGQAAAWDRVVQRRALLMRHWPNLTPAAGLGRLYDWLDAASDEDVERLIAVASWVLANPASGLYLRQLPIVGVDTKWIESGQRRAVAMLVAMLQGASDANIESERAFLRLCGLRAPETRVRIMVLDSSLRRVVGGVRDLQAPLSELGSLPWAPRATLFLENLDSAHSLPDLPSTVAVVGLGRAVSVAQALPWIHGSQTFYWGDIDSDGLEILSLARASFPYMQSVLMDRGTLLRHRERWVGEGTPNGHAARDRLTAEERALYEDLLANVWVGWDRSEGVRLEQERLDWPHVEEHLLQTLGIQEARLCIDLTFEAGRDSGRQMGSGRSDNGVGDAPNADRSNDGVCD